MGWRQYTGLGLLLLMPTTVLMVALWLCPCTWFRPFRRWLSLLSSEPAGETHRARQSVSEEFSIPSKVVGWVIGRNGATVRQFEEQSGARIKFKDQQDSQDKVIVLDLQSCIMFCTLLVHLVCCDVHSSWHHVVETAITMYCHCLICSVCPWAVGGRNCQEANPLITSSCVCFVKASIDFLGLC